MNRWKNADEHFLYSDVETTTFGRGLSTIISSDVRTHPSGVIDIRRNQTAHIIKLMKYSRHITTAHRRNMMN